MKIKYHSYFMCPNLPVHCVIQHIGYLLYIYYITTSKILSVICRLISPMTNVLYGIMKVKAFYQSTVALG